MFSNWTATALYSAARNTTMQGAHDMSAIGKGALGNRTQRSRPSNFNLACTECHKRKIKCVVEKHEECNNCLAHGRICEFREHRRAGKRKRRADGNPACPDQEARAKIDHSPSHIDNISRTFCLQHHRTGASMYGSSQHGRVDFVPPLGSNNPATMAPASLPTGWTTGYPPLHHYRNTMLSARVAQPGGNFPLSPSHSRSSSSDTGMTMNRSNSYQAAWGVQQMFDHSGASLLTPPGPGIDHPCGAYSFSPLPIEDQIVLVANGMSDLANWKNALSGINAFSSPSIENQVASPTIAMDPLLVMNPFSSLSTQSQMLPPNIGMNPLAETNGFSSTSTDNQMVLPAMGSLPAAAAPGDQPPNPQQPPAAIPLESNSTGRCKCFRRCIKCQALLREADPRAFDRVLKLSAAAVRACLRLLNCEACQKSFDIATVSLVGSISERVLSAYKNVFGINLAGQAPQDGSLVSPPPTQHMPQHLARGYLAMLQGLHRRFITMLGRFQCAPAIASAFAHQINAQMACIDAWFSGTAPTVQAGHFAGGNDLGSGAGFI